MKRFFGLCSVCFVGTKKADTFICCECGVSLCPKHAAYYVDGNNRAIMKAQRPHCFTCYYKKWNR